MKRHGEKVLEAAKAVLEPHGYALKLEEPGQSKHPKVVAEKDGKRWVIPFAGTPRDEARTPNYMRQQARQVLTGVWRPER